jgi:hypothetical protein
MIAPSDPALMASTIRNSRASASVLVGGRPSASIECSDENDRPVAAHLTRLDKIRECVVHAMLRKPGLSAFDGRQYRFRAVP